MNQNIKKISLTFFVFSLLLLKLSATVFFEISESEKQVLYQAGFSKEVVENLYKEISPEKAFFNKYNISMFSSQAKLTLMNKKSSLAKLGKETIKGNKSGSLKYHARIKKFGCDVQMSFKNYCDFDNFVINGESNVSAKMNMCGKMYGTVIVSDNRGKEIGRVVYDKIEIIKGVDGGGYYTVTLKGRNPCQIKWNEVLRPDREELEPESCFVIEVSN